MAGGLTRITVRLTPRAGRDAIDGWAEDGGQRVLRVRVAAPPADGRANEALVRLLAKALGVAPSHVCIAAGAQARTKVVEVEGVSEGEVYSLAAGQAHGERGAAADAALDGY